MRLDVMMQEVDKTHELVSALADGQLHGDEFASMVEWISDDEDAQVTWHAYHLVGDVLRSGEGMARHRDAAFMQRLKLSLQQETPVSPQLNAIKLIVTNEVTTGVRGIKHYKNTAANDATFRWKLVAGVAALALVSIISWQGLSGSGDQPGTPALAQLQEPTTKPELTLQQAGAGADAPQRMIRDPQLDALLAAHRQFGGTSALQMPSGFLRNATFEGAAR